MIIAEVHSLDPGRPSPFILPQIFKTDHEASLKARAYADEWRSLHRSQYYMKASYYIIRNDNVVFLRSDKKI